MTPTSPSSALLFLTLTILLIAAFSLPGYSQSANQETDRVVWLIKGDTLHSRQLRVRGEGTTEAYLLLDNDRQVPVSLVSRFSGVHGTFVALPGSAGTDLYKVVQEGRRISTYSRTLFEAPLDTNGVRPVAYYFRKTGQTQMSLQDFHSLMNAMADNPAAQQQLQLTRTQIYAGLGITLASAAIAVVGIFESSRRHTQQTAITAPTNPFQPSTPLPPLSKASFSPLVLIGAGGMVAGMVVALSARHHEVKALNLYNQ